MTAPARSNVALAGLWGCVGFASGPSRTRLFHAGPSGPADDAARRVSDGRYVLRELNGTAASGVEPLQGSKWLVGFVTQGARRGAATLGYGVQRRWRWRRHGPWHPGCVPARWDDPSLWS
jgi:hypothetical protein